VRREKDGTEAASTPNAMGKPGFEYGNASHQPLKTAETLH
jgi:hypothetical protein